MSASLASGGSGRTGAGSAREGSEAAAGAAVGPVAGPAAGPVAGPATRQVADSVAGVGVALMAARQLGVGADKPPLSPRPAPVETTESPRLARLARDMAAARSWNARSTVLDAFWGEVRTTGAPLIETIEGDPGHRAVTFLWRGDTDTRQVLLLVNRLLDRCDLAASLMRRLPGTDVWHLTYRLRADHRGSYRIAPDTTGFDRSELERLADTAVPDPFNPRTVPTRWHGRPGSAFELPEAPARPWEARRDGVARGTVRRYHLASAALGSEREVWRYVPPETDSPGAGTAGAETARAETDVLVLLDGDMWFGQIGIEDTLDNLIADGAIPPLTVLAPHAVDNPTRRREFGGNPAYVDFLAAELLPWAAARLPVTDDPARTVIAGQSLGGLTALYAGYSAPYRFGNVLAQSSSLWWRPADELPGDTPWMTRRYLEGAPRELRLRLDVGLHEWGMLEQTRELRSALRARGYDVSGTDFNGGHDYVCWSVALADGLVRLLGR
ncbi:enterochelin esterase [Streptomyces varsoviensis]|nr:enterochelin esterase [Streptomyces varsoviensis]